MIGEIIAIGNELTSGRVLNTTSRFAAGLLFGAGHTASIISNRQELLPQIDTDGWYHIPLRGDRSRAKWPQPTPGAFNYYHESSKHLIDCILEDREPLVNVDWGLHITEMMAGAIESSETGRKYEMTTTLDY